MANELVRDSGMKGRKEHPLQMFRNGCEARDQREDSGGSLKSRKSGEISDGKKMRRQKGKRETRFERKSQPEQPECRVHRINRDGWGSGQERRVGNKKREVGCRAKSGAKARRERYETVPEQRWPPRAEKERKQAAKEVSQGTGGHIDDTNMR